MTKYLLYGSKIYETASRTTYLFCWFLKGYHVSDENTKVQREKRFCTSTFSPARKFRPLTTLAGEGSTSRSDWCWIPGAPLAGSQLI